MHALFETKKPKPPESNGTCCRVRIEASVPAPENDIQLSRPDVGVLLYGVIPCGTLIVIYDRKTADAGFLKAIQFVVTKQLHTRQDSFYRSAAASLLIS